MVFQWNIQHRMMEIIFGLVQSLPMSIQLMDGFVILMPKKVTILYAVTMY
jgi:hypothetical protein